MIAKKKKMSLRRTSMRVDLLIMLKSWSVSFLTRNHWVTVSYRCHWLLVISKLIQITNFMEVFRIPFHEWNPSYTQRELTICWVLPSLVDFTLARRDLTSFLYFAGDIGSCHWQVVNFKIYTKSWQDSMWLFKTRLHGFATNF